MAVPSYTADTLADYLVLVLGELGTILGWDHVHPQVALAVQQTERQLGDVAALSAARMAELEAVATVAVLRRAVMSLSARYDFADARMDAKRSQAFAQAQAMLADAELAAAPWISAYSIGISTIQYVHDPFAALPDELRTV